MLGTFVFCAQNPTADWSSHVCAFHIPTIETMRIRILLSLNSWSKTNYQACQVIIYIYGHYLVNGHGLSRKWWLELCWLSTLVYGTGTAGLSKALMQSCKKKQALETVTHLVVQYCICSGSTKVHVQQAITSEPAVDWWTYWDQFLYALIDTHPLLLTGGAEQDILLKEK